MKLLAIETSCDETGVCLVEADGNFGVDFRFRVLGNALYSQVAIHAPYGGVYPNLAKREHAKNLVPLTMQALEQSGALTRRGGSAAAPHPALDELLVREPELLEQLKTFLETYERPDIDCLAVTHGPGLEPALWVGVNFARALAIVWDIPLVAVNHMEGHIVMSMMRDDALATFDFPVLSLLISGGHTELVLLRQWTAYELIGQTRDDAAGEAFDKVARLLGLPYPGGPEISRLAAAARASGAPAKFSFTPPMLHSGDYDFSFSGLKTEVRKLVESLKAETGALDDDTKMDIARAFEDCVATVLVTKTLKAADESRARAVLVGGGVSANTYIREQLAAALMKTGDDITLLIPPPSLATDNALMIALPGYFRALKREFADPTTLKASGNLHIA